ncbi:hypothetical protein J1C56_08555 [Aminobacter anthyllidis]|uniref:MHYT domain-containing protein n=1 Tax=Aminobacter anthyllidis TaxID=1035067 RepID=A0A9X1D5G6_9HYPH|nr:MHYT domain-containing protein [Aminobacter anthyllidis]MBT1155643.1 hypothetical protein [Aminobacter anthyllidis]
MLTVLNCLVTEHDYRFVAAALTICALGCVVSMRLFARARNVRRAKHAAFIFMAGVAGGMTIWTTHFLAMLGFIPNVEHGFEPNFTVLSLAFAIATSMAGFFIAASRERGWMIETGGAIIGAGIALMHFTGMRGFVVAGTVSYDPAFVAFPSWPVRPLECLPPTAWRAGPPATANMPAWPPLSWASA